jgi:hypothetical protein
MSDYSVSVKIGGSPPIVDNGIYYRGLSDYQSNNPLGGIYCDEGYYPRNWTPPNMRPPVPEVRRFKNASDNIYMTEGIEWMWFYLFQINSGWSSSQTMQYFERHTRTDAAYTNKVAWNSDPPRKSFVLGKPGNKPVQLLGIVCPGGNLFRGSGSENKTVKDEMSTAVWNLDYSWLVENITKSNALDFARNLPLWLFHEAKIVHPVKIGSPTPSAPNGIFKVENWDGNFCVPNIAETGRQAIVDGYHVRENWLVASRLNKITP